MWYCCARIFPHLWFSDIHREYHVFYCKFRFVQHFYIFIISGWFCLFAIYSIVNNFYGKNCKFVYLIFNKIKTEKKRNEWTNCAIVCVSHSANWQHSFTLNVHSFHCCLAITWKVASDLRNATNIVN